MTDQPGGLRPSGRSGVGSADVEALDGLARELLVASQALFDAGRALQRHVPDAGEPPADQRVSDLQRVAIDALRSLAGGLDATAAAGFSSGRLGRADG